MKRLPFLLLIAVCVFTSSLVSAELVHGIDIDFVTIGNAGNPGDTRTGLDDWGRPLADPYGCGAVDYTYQIGKYEVTNGQWDAFVSAAGTPTGNLSIAYDEDAYWTGTNVPANEISWYEAAQFCNYLTSGDKSKGAYQFSGNNTNPGDFLGIDRNASVTTYGTTYVLPTEDEWYKAAYYTGNGYSTYANGTDVAPVKGTNTNYDWATDQPWEVGVGNGVQEQNGTFDMMGNVYEWNETTLGPYFGVRGGGYSNSISRLTSSGRRGYPPAGDYYSVGFRVVSVPEPATLALLVVGGLLIRKRK